MVIMIDEEFGMDYILHWNNVGSSWRSLERIKYLEAFLQAIESKLMELEKDSSENSEELAQEKSLSKAIQKEIRRLERKTFYEELGE